MRRNTGERQQGEPREADACVCGERAGQRQRAVEVGAGYAEVERRRLERLNSPRIAQGDSQALVRDLLERGASRTWSRCAIGFTAR